jgi:hypothetical protein
VTNQLGGLIFFSLFDKTLFDYSLERRK